MSKNKDVEKLHDKQLEKKIEIKEHTKIEKHEPKEIKEPIKEHKDKDIEKPIFEKGGKELVEGQHPGSTVTNPAAGINATTHLGHAGGGAAPAAKAKEIEKIKAEKEHIEKIKPEKEHLKNELKDLKHEKNELKEHKIEIKEVKHEKQEIKELEKAQHKDLLPEKAIFEGGPKQNVEGPIDKGTVDPGPIFNAKAKPEQRLTDLENAVTRLSHFIGADLRPDLSGGALKQEPDVAKAAPAKKAAAKKRARPKKTAG